MPKITGTMMIGVGGVGSALLQPLAALMANDPDFYGEADHKGVLEKPKLWLVDGDSYEEKNLRNQCITPQDVGMNKADWAATLVSGLVDPVVWDEYIEGPLTIQSWLINQRAEQDKREQAGVFGGFAVIIIPVDNDHCRNFVYKALDESPNVNVLVIDPANGAGDDADHVDCSTYMRVYNPEDDQSFEMWPSPLLKYPQLQKPKGRNPKTGCAEKAESQPQLRTANMRAALYTYEALELVILATPPHFRAEQFAYAVESHRRRHQPHPRCLQRGPHTRHIPAGDRLGRRRALLLRRHDRRERGHLRRAPGEAQRRGTVHRGGALCLPLQSGGRVIYCSASAAVGNLMNALCHMSVCPGDEWAKMGEIIDELQLNEPDDELIIPLMRQCFDALHADYLAFVEKFNA